MPTLAALEAAKRTVGALQAGAQRVALYLTPNGSILRVVNPRLLDDDVTHAFVGVYSLGASAKDIADDITATRARLAA